MRQYSRQRCWVCKGYFEGRTRSSKATSLGKPLEDLFVRTGKRCDRKITHLRIPWIYPWGVSQLVLSSIGEIGNNCFDHNLGFWQDEPGCLFIREEKFCVIADRGQGIKRSLQKVYELTKDDTNYISVAFHKVITGRAPEKRGNVLKFTRKNLLHCQVNLFCYSDGETFIQGNAMLAPPLKIQSIKGSGTFSLLYWWEYENWNKKVRHSFDL